MAMAVAPSLMGVPRGGVRAERATVRASTSTAMPLRPARRASSAGQTKAGRPSFTQSLAGRTRGGSPVGKRGVFKCLAFNPLESQDADDLDMEELMTDVVDTSTLGQRGELLFIGQVVLIVFVVFGVPEKADVGAKLVAVLSVVLGTIGALYGVKNLGNSLSPFPKPRESNKLVVSGVYNYVRHPMYTGLMCLGFASVTFAFSPAKFALYMALCVLLDAKAELEESYLTEKHGDAYGAYCARVGKFLPYLDFLGPDSSRRK